MPRWPCREGHATGVMTSGGGAWGMATPSTLLCPQLLLGTTLTQAQTHPEGGDVSHVLVWGSLCGEVRRADGEGDEGSTGQKETLSLKNGRSLSWGFSTLLAPSCLSLCWPSFLSCCLTICISH